MQHISEAAKRVLIEAAFMSENPIDSFLLLYKKGYISSMECAHFWAAIQ